MSSEQLALSHELEMAQTSSNILWMIPRSLGMKKKRNILNSVDIFINKEIQCP